jgi:hypothetical protein
MNAAGQRREEVKLNYGNPLRGGAENIDLMNLRGNYNDRNTSFLDEQLKRDYNMAKPQEDIGARGASALGDQSTSMAIEDSRFAPLRD